MILKKFNRIFVRLFIQNKSLLYETTNIVIHGQFSNTNSASECRINVIMTINIEYIWTYNWSYVNTLTRN